MTACNFAQNYKNAFEINHMLKPGFLLELRMPQFLLTHVLPSPWLLVSVPREGDDSRKCFYLDFSQAKIRST